AIYVALWLQYAHISSIHSFFFSSRRRHTRFSRDWSSDVCSSDLVAPLKKIGMAAMAAFMFPFALAVGVEFLFCRIGSRQELETRSEERRVGKECSTWC